MRRRSLTLLVVAAGALVLGSAASGARGSVSRSALALMPLPKSALGAAAASLPLDSDSGVQTNADAARNATGEATAAQLGKLGRITGYDLDYNDAAAHALAARRGLLEVATGVELYRGPAAARKGLAFWRKDDTNVTKLRTVGISASMKLFRVAGVTRPSYGATAVLKVGSESPIHLVEVVFVAGPLVAKIEVSAADAADRRGYAVSLAKQLAARIRGVLAGGIKGPPVPLPAKAKAGPPPHGPELSLLTLSPSDLGGGTIKQQGYKLDKDTSLGKWPMVVEAGTPLFKPSQATVTVKGAMSGKKDMDATRNLPPGEPTQILPKGTKTGLPERRDVMAALAKVAKKPDQS